MYLYNIYEDLIQDEHTWDFFWFRLLLQVCSHPSTQKTAPMSGAVSRNNLPPYDSGNLFQFYIKTAPKVNSAPQQCGICSTTHFSSEMPPSENASSELAWKYHSTPGSRVIKKKKKYLALERGQRLILRRARGGVARDRDREGVAYSETISKGSEYESTSNPHGWTKHLKMNREGWWYLALERVERRVVSPPCGGVPSDSDREEVAVARADEGHERLSILEPWGLCFVLAIWYFRCVVSGFGVRVWGLGFQFPRGRRRPALRRP